MDVDCAETFSQPCTPLNFNPMTPSTSRVSTPVRPSSTMSARQYSGSPFKAQPQNMEPSNSRVQELREAAVGKRSYTNAWMQGTYAPPQMAGQQQRFSRPPSVIGSTMSHMTNMSEMTAYSYGGLSMLSVNTEMGEFNNFVNQAPYQRALTRVSQVSENQDPTNRQYPMTAPEIIENLESTELINQAAAIRALEPIVKAGGMLQTWGPKGAEPIIRALFQVLIPRPVENENVIRKAFEILHHSILLSNKEIRRIDRMFFRLNAALMDPNGPPVFNVPKPYSIYEIVMTRAIQLDTKFESSAMVLLVHLCCKPHFMKIFFGEDETQQSPAHRRLHKIVIEFAIGNLRRPETKSKNKGLCVSIIKNLSNKNATIKDMSERLGVVSLFHQIMQNEVIHEDLLWSTMQALTVFCGDVKNGTHFVQMGGAQVLCGLLSHGSTRLLHELLKCLRRVSDLPAIQEQDMKESIHCIVQLIGCSDVTIVELATGTLRNIGLHNKMNKAFMVQDGVTSHAIAVLRTSEQFTYQPHANIDLYRKQILSIYENCLSVLNNVTSMAPQDIKESAVSACRMISENADSAYVLLHYFNVGNRKCRKLAVTVMKRVIETVPAFADPFVDLLGTTNEPLPILLLQRAFQSLDEWRKTSVEMMNCDGRSAEQRRELDDRRKDHEDIVKRSVGLLTNLCSQANPRFFHSLKLVLTNGTLNPFQWLTHEMSDGILQEWLAFILSICSRDESLQTFMMYRFLEQAKMTEAFFAELKARRQNSNIQTMLSKIIDLGRHQQRIVSQQHQQHQMQHHRQLM
ncbi:Armadillo repeat-containing protein wrm-1 [Caenorhabditis elegans]|uniref:Armadillo repeat-containing protein wrm-1 n=2 Tax=Caenorhabditis elegans TaxID=6239 RepID=WRM1_CAEEL|nr:Armadillo repeat-containing protein wrm-1 [Caenorhabditis elegans]Q10953.2 RecName: Full=Armadillo repeat-containing protein wrm-1; AltName: Full=Worm armadillo protein 1 [Caenorhabditis elegans]AAC47748.1 endoderm specification [Caenorhabditis elegans]CCD61515.1 Armadillo repeat-containing protein wrm-1 [Caenorhabditis elegans]|eukprot:NP_498236.1 Armadillo repeat-containing protein wrm-1 [Caenorhabditis elegans]